MNGSGERFPYPAAGAVIQGLGNDHTRNLAKTDRLLLTDLAARSDPFRRAFVWGYASDPHTNALRNGSARAEMGLPARQGPLLISWVFTGGYF